MKFPKYACLLVSASFISCGYAATNKSDADIWTGSYLSAKLGVGIERLGQDHGRLSYDNDGDSDSISAKKKARATVLGAVAAGYDFYSQFDLPFRAELEYSLHGKAHWDSAGHRTSDEDGSYKDGQTGDVGLQTLMVNAYYDYHNSTDFTPYAMVGLGWAHINYSAKAYSRSSDGDGFNQKASGDTNNFVWSVGFGVAYQVIDNLSLDLSYRYVNAGDIRISSNRADGYGDRTHYKTGTDVESHDILLGARYTF